METCCSGCSLLYSYVGLLTSGFEVTTVLGADFWICVCLVGVLLLDFCSIFFFSVDLLAMCCLFYLIARLMCSRVG